MGQIIRLLTDSCDEFIDCESELEKQIHKHMKINSVNLL